MHRIDNAILATLCYSDIFDYPLTKAQVWRYLIWVKNPSSLGRSRKSQVISRLSTFEDTLDRLVKEKRIESKNGYYFLPKRGRIVTLREERKKISEEKMKKAQKVVGLLMHIPTILCIGISGSLAMASADKDADIDLFIITKKNTLWITRIFVLLLLEYKRLRRRRGTSKAPNTICVNMLVDENHLTFPLKRRDVYTAHEIIQMKSLFSRSSTYELFLKKNAWISTMLPHAFTKVVLDTPLSTNGTSSVLRLFEPFAKLFQIGYMRSHKTKEVILSGFVAFHPFDYRSKILSQWEKRKHRYGI